MSDVQNLIAELRRASEHPTPTTWTGADACRCAHAADIIAGLVAEIDRLRAALRDATEWRPMESAPRDGTEVLVLYMGGACCVLYQPIYEGMFGWWSGMWGYLREADLEGWLPLPAPLPQVEETP